MFSLNLYKNGVNSEDALQEIENIHYLNFHPWWPIDDGKTDIRTSPYIERWLIAQNPNFTYILPNLKNLKNLKNFELNTRPQKQNKNV